ncbi:MAG: FKBP-type peptidyl-prolyl cis-trans isomerase [Ardenticatenaceae bacterium]|nr:FKBP-type peptidyl-prolyl cis-trans isomerase [Ardenticatenaceae bacterium]
MNYLRVNKIWLLAVVSLMVMWVVACGPAQPRNEEEATAVPADTTSTDTTDVSGIGTDTTVGPAAPEMTPTPLPNAIITDSGLQYAETKAGDGVLPQDGDIIELNFIGKLTDGTVFGDTYTQGGPITVILGQDQLFTGWEEGMKLMSAGGSATLVIPPELAFGETGAGGIIPANATIIMDVELLSVTPPPEPAAVDEADFTTTDSGLKYYDLVVGEGDMPAAGDDVTVEFVLWVQDGMQYIVSSAQNGAPLTFTLGKGDIVFPGWDEGVATMQTGGKRQLIIPSELGLGELEGPGIPANSTLVMEIELLSWQPTPKPVSVDEADYTVTDSGLKYYDIVSTDGPTPTAGQTVEVNYTGWLTDGTKFDSSYDRDQTFTFVLGQGGVIAGWDEGVATMSVGSTRQLVIPSELGYGATGAGGLIPPNATLIFEVELVSIR